MTTETEPVTEEKKDEIWIPFSELKAYLAHMKGMLSSMVKGIDGSLEFIEKSAEENRQGDDNDDTNDEE